MGNLERGLAKPLGAERARAALGELIMGVRPDADAVPTVRRLRPDILIVDLDLPDLRALDIAREVRSTHPGVAIIFLTDRTPLPLSDPVLPNPHDRFEELLHLFQVVLALQR